MTEVSISSSVGVRRLLSLLLLVLMALAGTAQAQAGICEQLSSQLRGSEGGNPALTQLNRQLSALRSLERQRRCNGKSFGGFFNGCNEIVRRKEQVQNIILASSRSSGGNNAAVKARMASLGCFAKAAKQERGGGTAPSASGSWVDGNDLLFCVRPSDGYYFPAPNSQFVQAADYRLVKSQCQYICDDAEMEVYELGSVAMETEDMISVERRTPYKDLRTAFAYRDRKDFRTCNSQRYNQRVNEARARATTPASVDVGQVVLPIPKSRPEMETVMAYSEEPQPVDASEAARRVRIVGSPFLPDTTSFDFKTPAKPKK